MSDLKDFAGMWRKFSKTESEGARMEKCVSYVSDKAGVVKAYGVCTAILADDTYKSMDESAFLKEVDLFLQKLGIAGAGPIPNSLLARQDLEPNSTSKAEEPQFIKNLRRLQKREGGGVCVYYTDKTGNKQEKIFDKLVDAEAYARDLAEVQGFNNIIVNKGAYDWEDSDSTEKKAGDWWIVRHNGSEYMRFATLKEARECVDMLCGQGMFAVIIAESVVDMSKGVLETTGKQLTETVKDAREAHTTRETASLVDRIKNIQERRQSGTIAARAKEAVGKTFRQGWDALVNKKAE